MISRFVILVLLTFSCLQVSAQQIRESDIMFRKHIVRSVNLKRFNNEEIFGRQNMLVTVLLDAVKSGRLIPYKTSHLDEALSIEQFLDKIRLPEEGNYYDGWSSYDEEWKEAIGESSEAEDSYYAESQLFRIEIGEDIMFDKHRSDVLFDMKYITLFIPAEVSSKGLHEPVASFRFADCMDIFKQDKRAIAENPLNNGMNINFADVFYLRLYKSYIVKLGRIDDPYFDQMYKDPVQAFVATKNAENKVIEYFYKIFNPK